MSYDAPARTYGSSSPAETSALAALSFESSRPGCLSSAPAIQPVIVRMLGQRAENRVAELLSVIGIELQAYSDSVAFEAHPPVDVPSCLIIDAGLFLNPQDEDCRLWALCKAHPTILVAAEPEVSLIVRAMRAGAIDFLKKPWDDRALLSAIDAALRIDRRRQVELARNAELRRRFVKLTPRERQVMGFVTAGRLNKQIAYDLGLSQVTVKVHRGSAMRKMEARSLAELVRMADAVRELGGAPDSESGAQDLFNPPAPQAAKTAASETSHREIAIAAR